MSYVQLGQNWDITLHLERNENGVWCVRIKSEVRQAPKLFMIL